MSFTEAVQTCFEKIITVEGRARRSEYWYFALCVFLINIVLNVVFRDGGAIVRIITFVLNIATLTVSIRRLHDIGKSGWWYLLVFVPVIGWILLIYWFCKDSQPGANMYGENPKGVN